MAGYGPNDTPVTGGGFGPNDVPVTQQKSPPQQAGMGWGQVGQEALLNFGPSALQVGKDYWNAFRHPIQTAKAAGNLLAGGVQRLNDVGSPQLAGMQPQRIDTSTADAYGQHMKDRYGGLENIKRTLATDPVGFMADASVPLTAGGGAAARVPGVVGRAGRAAQAAGAATDPLSIVGTGAKVWGGAAGDVASVVPAVTTGAGRKPFTEAARIGYSGTPEENKAFRGNYMGSIPKSQVATDAKDALATIRQERRGAYERQTSLLGQNTTQLDIAPIIDEWNALQQSFLVGDGTLSRAGEQTQGTLRKISGVVEQWARNPSAHTVMGLDALKQRIRDEVGSFQSLTDTEKHVVTEMTNKVKSIIEQQAPEYAQIMKAYETESRLIDELESTLSLGNAKMTDQAMRKLQSVMRNNANTNYDQRFNLVSELEQRGGKPIVPALAGQALNAWEPRGLGPVTAVGPLTAAGTLAAKGQFIPAGLSLIPMLANSPKIAGGATYAGGWAAGRTRDLVNALGGAETSRAVGQAGFQSNRAEERRKALIAQLAGK